MAKKRIQYLWINNWRCFCNSEFNFTSKYNIHYSLNERKLIITSNNTFVDNFYDEKIEISTIVGENGVGKTSLLEFLLKFADGDDATYSDVGTFITVIEEIYDENNSNLITYYHDWGDTIKPIVCLLDGKEIDCKEAYPKNQTAKLLNFSDENCINNFLKTDRFVYYTDSFHNNINFEFWGQTVLAPCRKLCNLHDNNYMDLVKTYFVKEFTNQILFVEKFSKIITNFNIDFPKSVEIRLIVKPVKEEEKTFYNKLVQIFGEQTFQGKLAIEIIRYLYNNSNYESLLEININNPNVFIGQKDTSGILKCVLHKICDNGNTGNSLIEFFNYFETFICSSNNVKFGNGCISISTLDTSGILNLQNIKQLIEKYESAVLIGNILGFNWSISSGESSLLSLFSNIYFLCQNDNNTFYIPKQYDQNDASDNVILMLDEAEISLHPEWQRKLINALVEFLKTLNNNFQVFVATHSPLILSDVPRQNVLVLSKESDSNKAKQYINETFGANIYDLYNNQFFLDRYIGEYSYKKIGKAIDVIYRKFNSKILGNNQNAIPSIEEYTEAKKIVSLIGDVLLKKETNKMIEIIDKAKEKN